MLVRIRLLFLLLPLIAPPAPGYAQPTKPAAVISLPFDLVGGLIVLRNLAINGKRGDFVLDTGCTYALVVDAASFAGQLHPSTKRGLSAAGSSPLYEVPITQFGFAPAHTPQTALATSLAAIRAIVGTRLLGLIGTELLRHYEVVIDYAHGRLSCYPLGSPAARPFVRRDSVAFTLEKGWPVAIGFIGSVPVQLLLDTGAHDNFLNAEFAQALPTGSRPRKMKTEFMVAPNGRVPAQRSVLPLLQVGATEWQNIPLLVAPAVHYQSGRSLPYQGILGNLFFRQEPMVSFHYGRQKFFWLKSTQR